MIPKQGPLSWPGRESLDHRERILLEARTLTELIQATGTVPGDLDAALGWSEYLYEDWRRLRDLTFCGRAPRTESVHKRMVRESAYYRKVTNWQGDVPRHQGGMAIIPHWYSQRN